MQKIFLGISLAIVTHTSIAANRSESKAAFKLEEATITSIHDTIKADQLTCEQLIQHYLERIKRYNLSASAHAPINAFTEINVNVIDQAKKIDDAYAKSKLLKGSLHCIPVVLKDNIDSYDSTSTSGTLALLGNQPHHDAFLVAKLREAGAIILGKGGMDELASGMVGINSRNGRVGNAYQSDQNPGGSSGGSAAAVSANFTMVGIGTDNSGSVRIPAAFNGIYGLRPSTGLISQNGIFPAGNLDGTAGPLARTVEDLARVLDVIAQADKNDSKTTQVPRVSTYTTFLNEDGLKNKRIGIVRSVGNIDTFKAMPNDIEKTFSQSLQALQQAGALIVDDIKLPQFNNNRKLNMAGMRQDINAYLASYPAARKDFQDLCESNRTRIYGNIKKCLRFFEVMPIKFGNDYKKALTMFNQNKLYVDKIMAEHQLDALLMPISTTGVATYDPYKVNTWQAPIASNVGLPAITINLGYTHDQMPIGVELIGKQYTEGALIEMAYAYEKQSGSRIIPTMPELNGTYEKLDLPAYNNVLTNIGYKSYYEVLMNPQSDQVWKDLTPQKFHKIVKNQSF